MNPFITFMVLLAAFALSWYSAHRMGRFWTESKIVGGSTRLMVIASLILSGLGFTGVYFTLLVMLLSAFYPEIEIGKLFPVSLGVLSMPGAGSVPSLWMNSQVAARRQQMLGAMSTPGFNLPVDPGDILDMSLSSRGLFRWVGDLFTGGGGSGGDGGGDSDSWKLMLILLVIGLAILALMAGAVTTILIVQAVDKEHVGEIVELYKPLETASS